MRLYASKRIAPGLRVGMSVPVNGQCRTPARRPASEPPQLPDVSNQAAADYYGFTADEARFATDYANRQQLAEAHRQQALARKQAKKEMSKARMAATEPKALKPVAGLFGGTLFAGLFFPPLLVATLLLFVTLVVLAVRWSAAAERLPGGRNYKPGPQ